MTDGTRPRPSRIPRLALPFAALFVLSGACGLTYQVVWSRLLVHVFGVTAFAVSTVLVSFMGGMALGAALLGKRADRSKRPLRMFALLEAGIGLYALVLPLLLRAVDAAYSAAFPVLPEDVLIRSAFRFVACLAVLLVPTVLMGATLPALGQGLLRRRGEVGLGVGLLYFVNTLGAAIGCWLAGFALIPHLGLTRTTLLAVAGNGIVATVGWILDRREASAPGASMPEPREASVEVSPEPPRPLARPASWPLWVAFGSGMAALGFEVVWFRILVLSFGSTVYSFSAMLSVFLLGLALGSILIGPFVDRVRHPIRLLAGVQAAVAATALAGLVAVNAMPPLFLHVIRSFGLDFDGMNRAKMLLSAITLLPPALAFGATFPITVRLYSGREGGTGSRIGRVYAWNTAGAILGSFGAGFVLLPTIGTEWVLRLVVLLSLTLAFGSFAADPGRLRARWAVPAAVVGIVLAAGLAFAPRWDRELLGAGAYFDPSRFYAEDGSIDMRRVLADYELMTFTEGYNDTIISFRTPKGKFITVNGSATASDQFEDMFSQRMLGHLPMALHPTPVRKALIVGLGAGVTAGAIGLYEVDELVAVELEQGVFAASRFFEQENHGVLDNPAVRIRIDDGRNYLKMTDERFDVISSAPNFPSLSGSGALYSRELFELGRGRLADGGVMCQFVPIWRLYPSEVKTIVGSFADVFPNVRVFSTGLSLVMLGRVEPFPPVDFDEVDRRVSRPEVRASLLEIGVRGPVEMLSFFQMDETEISAFAGDAPRNTDDRPRIEFFAPRALFASTVGANLEALREYRPAIDERVGRLGLTAGEIADSYRALAAGYDATVEGEILMSQGAINEGFEMLLPAADSGQRYARYLVADHAEKNGLELHRQGKLRDARAALYVAVLYEPDRLDALVGLGHVSLQLGAFETAEAVLVDALERYPRSAVAMMRLGLLRELQGDRVEAERLYRAAVQTQPELADGHFYLGRYLVADGRAEAALAELEIALRLGADGSSLRAALAWALHATGRSEDAVATARAVLDVEPDSEDALAVLEAASRALGNKADADAAAARLRELRDARERVRAGSSDDGTVDSGR